MSSYTSKTQNIQNVVLDSSVIAKWFIDEEGSLEARSIYSQAQELSINICAPTLAQFEIGNVLVKKKFSAIHARYILQTLNESPIKWIDMTTQIMNRTYDIAIAYQITFYDSVFIACAESVEANLISANVKHQGKYSGVVKIKSLL